MMGRMPSIWGEDCLEYKPERWIIGEGGSKSVYEYPVFHAGPRICLGKSMAELEGVFVIVSLLKSFKFEIIDVNQVEKGVALTLPMKTGLKCRVEKRIS